MFSVRENRRNELVERGHHRPVSSEILPWWEHDSEWRCRPKRVPIIERGHRVWYSLRRNSNLYEIFLFRKAHCTLFLLLYHQSTLEYSLCVGKILWTCSTDVCGKNLVFSEFVCFLQCTYVRIAKKCTGASASAKTLNCVLWNFALTTHNFVGTHPACTVLLYATNFIRGELNSKGMRWFSIKSPIVIILSAKFSIFYILGPSHENYHKP